MTKANYPMRLLPVYKDKIWGGRRFASFRSDAPSGDLGESWDIGVRSDCNNVITNGTFSGERLGDVIARCPQEMLGIGFDAAAEFPLLIKLIGAEDDLSVQVHPGDAYAELHENCSGKTELWYVLDAEPGAELIAGLQGCTKESLHAAIEQNDLPRYLKRIPIRRGDALLLPAGMVHALCAGAFVAEIQQNCDITYRLYDYGRPRALHIEKAIDVIDPALEPQLQHTADFSAAPHRIAQTQYFTVDLLTAAGALSLPASPVFRTLTCAEGAGEILCGAERIAFAFGDSLFLPAAMSCCSIEGNCRMLLTTPAS